MPTNIKISAGRNIFATVDDKTIIGLPKQPEKYFALKFLREDAKNFLESLEIRKGEVFKIIKHLYQDHSIKISSEKEFYVKEIERVQSFISDIEEKMKVLK